MQELGNLGKKTYYLDNGVLKYLVPSVRDAVRADPGRVLLISDYSQIEIRLMAFESQDPWLISAINSKKDMHCYMAADVSDGLYSYDVLLAAKKGTLPFLYAGELVDAKGKPITSNGNPYSGPQFDADELIACRSDTKTCSFGIPYGAGPDRIAAMIQKRDKRTGLPTEPFDHARARAVKLIKKYFEKASVLKQYLDAQGFLALRTGISRTPRGRIRNYTLPDKSDPDYAERISQIGRWAGNHGIQGGCSDLLKPALARFYRLIRGGKANGPRLIDARILLTIHDEIVADAAEKDKDRAAEVLREAMLWSYDQIELQFGDTVRRLNEIYNELSVTTADYWVKD